MLVKEEKEFWDERDRMLNSTERSSYCGKYSSVLSQLLLLALTCLIAFKLPTL